ncbi:terminase small subunit [Solimonas soli]|uniref:terminase small subunit n=1 Tax=Solimonas soli TaxID=413479 RepID=UPI000686B005|nr:terminase small subunit [Solimonas soli]
MPVLSNPRHELFAQEVAKGQSQRAAYRAAGYDTESDDATDAAASRLVSDVRVSARITEIQSEAAKVAEMTAQRIFLAWSKIATADIRKVAKWSNQERLIDGEDGKVRVESEVLFIPSNELDDDTAAAIAEVSHGKNGLRVKMHDKVSALANMARYLGMFTDKVQHTGKDGEPLIPPLGDIDLAKAICFALEAAVKKAKESAQPEADKP